MIMFISGLFVGALIAGSAAMAVITVAIREFGHLDLEEED